MANWYDEATWTCPICDYTLFGNEPAVHVICDNCKKKDEGHYDPNGLPKDFTDRYHD
ncbi:MAG: Uncharacterised protein [Chloroflexota bacterium]|nr:MAG: Uncharacterised protein [Chloroflexota bacterium]|tara:strand:+ start:252 stop:422 length:171 start_codon:yes stop_codon:yes gene_type:complete